MARRSSRYLCVIVGVVLVAGCSGVQEGAKAFVFGIPDHPPRIGGEPPKQPFLVLSKGKVRRYRWDAILYRHWNVACLETWISTEGLSSCGNPEPLLVNSNSTGSGSKEGTAIGIVGVPPIARVRLFLRGRHPLWVVLEELGRRGAKRTHLHRGLRAAALSVGGSFCLVRFQGFDREGARRYTSDVHPCSEQ